MPNKGVKRISHAAVLRFEEMLRICRILSSLGISTVRITGGEPLVRKGVVNFVRELKAINGIDRVTITSNGMLLCEHLHTLISAGLNAVNISLDTLNEDRFQHLTKGEGVLKIINTIDMALDLGLEVKINCVPIRGFNEMDIAQLAGLAKNRNIAVRFIELMPLGVAANIKPIPVDEITSIIEKEHGPLTASHTKKGSGPAAYYTLQGFLGQIGIIGALSHGFCEKCNRLRLTSSGILKPCLSSDLGVDLRQLVRDNVSNNEIKIAVMELIGKKPASHNFGTVIDRLDHSTKEMFRIGG